MDYEERFGATLNAELDLREFPFDDQALDVELQSFVWDECQIVLSVNQAQTGFDWDFETPEWQVNAVEALIGVRSEVRDDRGFSSFTLRVFAQRRSGHYVLRLLLPLFFVMTLTWCAFWEPAHNRFQVGFVALLTVVAIHTVVSKNLPRISYATFADAVLFVCYIAAMALIVVSIVVQQAEARGATERAKKIDRWARWLLPVFAVVVLTGTILLLWD